MKSLGDLKDEMIFPKLGDAVDARVGDKTPDRAPIQMKKALGRAPKGKPRKWKKVATFEVSSASFSSEQPALIQPGHGQPAHTLVDHLAASEEEAVKLVANGVKKVQEDQTEGGGAAYLKGQQPDENQQVLIDGARGAGGVDPPKNEENKEKP